MRLAAAIFQRKPIIPADILQKAGIFFDTVSSRRVNRAGGGGVQDPMY